REERALLQEQRRQRSRLEGSGEIEVMSRLKKHYLNKVRPEMQERFGYANSMLVPKLLKIVISMGVNEATKDKNAIQDALRELTLLSGQKPIITKTKTAIANFKTRTG